MHISSEPKIVSIIPHTFCRIMGYFGRLVILSSGSSSGSTTDLWTDIENVLVMSMVLKTQFNKLNKNYMWKNISIDIYVYYV